MRPSKAEVLEWERRWMTSAALAALAAVVLLIVAIVVGTQAVGNGNGEAALLRDVDQHRTAEMIARILQGMGIGVLAVPLYFLFHAAQSRSEKMRRQLVGVVIAAPLFLALASIFDGIATLHAATDFVAMGITGTGKHANEVASDASANTALEPFATGLGFAGQIGFVVAMVYTTLYAMRTGLLTRFWGSLGVALGAVSILSFLFQFVLLWFVYLALLLFGKVPGGRPPAWAAGEAIPWPTPGEKASAALSAGNGDGPAAGADSEAPSPEQQNGERRKRKQRD